MSDNEPVVLTRDELRDLMGEAVDEALLRIGIRADDPESVLEMQKDFQHLRDWRTAVNAVQRKGVLTIVALLVSGLVAAVWLGVKSALHVSGVPPA